jgi:hypothetical protein
MERLALDWRPTERRRTQIPDPEGGWPVPTSPPALANFDDQIARLKATLWTDPDVNGGHAWRGAEPLFEDTVRWLARELDDAAARSEIEVRFSALFAGDDDEANDPARPPELLAAQFTPRSVRAAALLRWRDAVRRKRPLGTCEWCGSLFAHGSRPGPRFCSQAHALAASYSRRGGRG